MKTRLVVAVVLGSAMLAAVFSVVGTAGSEKRVRWIILSTQHLGAHGLGYNSRSLVQLSRRLSPADVPALISLASTESDVSVGAQFALASQCEPAIMPAQEAAVQHKISFMDAEETMSLMSDFDGCDAKARQQASEMWKTLDRLRNAEYARIDQELKQKADDDARVQRNGLKLLDPEQAKTLTREERLEVFRRSLAAMGLTENGPMTPDQKKLVDRMYRSMVLDEVKTPPNQ